MVISFSDKPPSQSKKYKKVPVDYAEEGDLVEKLADKGEEKNYVAERFLVTVSELLQKNEANQELQKEMEVAIKEALIGLNGFATIIVYCLNNS